MEGSSSRPAVGQAPFCGQLTAGGVNESLEALGKEGKWSLNRQELAFPGPVGLPRGLGTSKKRGRACVAEPVIRTVLGAGVGTLCLGSEGKQSVEWPFAQTRGSTTQGLLGPSLMTGQGQEKCPVGLLMASIPPPLAPQTQHWAYSLHCLRLGCGGGG